MSAGPLAESAPSASSWIQPLVATLLVQAMAAFLTRIIPTIAPAVGPEFGWTDTTIGYLAAVTTFGSIAFLTSGSPLIRHAGPIRSLQIGLGLGLLGLALLPIPLTVLTIVGCLLIGLGYAPSSPAGSDILQRYAPARHRNLIFSVKQAGVPLGGVLAGVALPPIVEVFGWRATLVVSAVMVVVTILLIQPMRARLDEARSTHPLRARAFLSWENLARPVRAVADAPGTFRLSFTGACLAYGQGCWFAFLVTFAVVELGYSLTAAGLLFGVMQATGIAGRILLGWLSDRLGSGLPVLRAVSIGAALTSCAAALSGPDWPVPTVAMLAGIGGVTVASWNGVQIAEVARLAKPGQLGETAAGATLLVFIGLVAGPAIFAAILGLAGGFKLAFLSVALVSVLPLVALRRVPAQPSP